MLTPPGPLQPRLLGDSRGVPGETGASRRGGGGQKLPRSLPAFLLTAGQAVTNCKYRCHQTETSPKHTEPGPEQPQNWAESSLSRQGLCGTGTGTGRQSQGDGDLLWLGLLSALPRGCRLCLAERRELWRVRGRRDFPWGDFMALLYFSFQPFPSPCVSPQGQQTLGQCLC